MTVPAVHGQRPRSPLLPAPERQRPDARTLTGRDLTPAAAAAEGLVGDQPTLRWYARFLGRTCAHWGLATLCYSGLFLTGGMVLRNPAVTEHPAFAEGFSLAPELGVLERIPVRRYTDAYSGLWGAAWLGANLAGVSAGR